MTTNSESSGADPAQFGEPLVDSVLRADLFLRRLAKIEMMGLMRDKVFDLPGVSPEQLRREMDIMARVGVAFIMGEDVE